MLDTLEKCLRLRVQLLLLQVPTGDDWIEREFSPVAGENGLDLGCEIDGSPVALVQVKRLHSHPIARQEKAAFAPVQERKSPHAVEALKGSRPPRH